MFGWVLDRNEEIRGIESVHNFTTRAFCLHKYIPNVANAADMG
jgi:hypothetical protein